MQDDEEAIVGYAESDNYEEAVKRSREEMKAEIVQL
jgi:hypothetical protein